MLGHWEGKESHGSMPDNHVKVTYNAVTNMIK